MSLWIDVEIMLILFELIYFGVIMRYLTVFKPAQKDRPFSMSVVESANDELRKSALLLNGSVQEHMSDNSGSLIVTDDLKSSLDPNRTI